MLATNLKNTAVKMTIFNSLTIYSMCVHVFMF
uniref:Uncharacterized protein n=1 Tax=Anguilla anguilla TaxID=7936 RepID=A0A0E9XGB3_ANGAN